MAEINLGRVVGPQGIPGETPELTPESIVGGLGFTPVNELDAVTSVNGQIGDVIIDADVNKINVLAAIGYEPADANNVVNSINGQSGEVTLEVSVTSESIITALGYTPADESVIGDIASILDSINGEVV